MEHQPKVGGVVVGRYVTWRMGFQGAEEIAKLTMVGAGISVVLRNLACPGWLCFSTSGGERLRLRMMKLWRPRWVGGASVPMDNSDPDRGITDWALCLIWEIDRWIQFYVFVFWIRWLPA